MRSFTKSLLLVLPALVFADSASAYKITVDDGSLGFPLPVESDMLSVDVNLDTEGYGFYGFQLYVDFDTGYLSPVSATIPDVGQDFSYTYMYPVGWYLALGNLATGIPAMNGPVATLVFHVVADIPASQVILIPNFDYGPYGIFVDDNAQDVTDDVTLVSLHVPEPATTMLMGLGLLGILCAGRRRQT